MPLKIAAKVPRAGNRYFRDRIEPMLIDKNIEFIGEVDDHAKQAFLGNATALLFPIDWPEPFGLVMIEAMACGTPVIAWRRGSVPEIVEDGVSGFIVESEAQAVEAIHRVRDLDRRTVRAVLIGVLPPGKWRLITCSSIVRLLTRAYWRDDRPFSSPQGPSTGH